MEGKNEVQSEPKPKNYQEFKSRCWNQALSLISAEGLREGYSEVSDRWDEFQFMFPEVMKTVNSISEKLKQELYKMGMDDETIEIELEKNKSEAGQVFEDYQENMRTVSHLDQFNIKSEDDKEDLESRLDNPIPIHPNHPFFSDASNTHLGLINCSQLITRNDKITTTEEYRIIIEADEKIKEIISYRDGILACLNINSGFDEDEEFNTKKLRVKPYILNIVKMITRTETNLDSQEEKLNNMIDGILNSWRMTEGEFLNIENAPTRDIREKLIRFIPTGDPAYFPTGIVGQPLDDLISDHIEPKERTWFMFIYTLRSLLNWDDDQYLTALYEKKPRNKK